MAIMEQLAAGARPAPAKLTAEDYSRWIQTAGQGVQAYIDSGMTAEESLNSLYNAALQGYDVPKSQIDADFAGLYSQYAPAAGSGGGGGGSTFDAEEEAMRNTLRSEISGRAGDVDNIYQQLFGSLDALLASRDSELESQYGDQFKKVSDQYAGAIPQIETSYAALGASDSTDTTYAKNDAKSGFDEATTTIGKNKKADKAKLGQYGKENRTKFNVDKEAAKRNIARSGETTDVNALRGLRNDLEGNIDSAKVTKATLGTDGDAAKSISKLTSDAGRYDAAVNALDSILKSSLAGSVKEAAVKAVTDNAGLSDEEKQKVQQTYGNVYSEQSTL